MSTDTKNSYTFQSLSSSYLIILRLASFLPLEGKSFTHPKSVLLQCYDYFIVIASKVCYSGYGIRMALRGDVEIDYICEDIITIGLFLRYIVMRVNREKFCFLVKSCEKLWDHLEVHEDIFVHQFMRKGSLFRNFIIFNTVFMTTFYNVAGLVVRLKANSTDEMILPYKFFLDVQEEPAYSFVFAVQIVIFYGVDLMLISEETVSLYLIMMACGYLRAVQNRLLSLEGSDDDSIEKGEVALKKIVSCAHFHQQILIYCDDVSRLTEKLFLISCFCPIYNVSITGYVLLSTEEDNLKFAPLILYNYFIFFLAQWAPEHLAVESENIAEAAYFASLRPLASSHREKVNRILYFMMMRAQKPVQLTAGGFARLSIQTFGVMTRSAVSFFMILQNFKG